MASCRRKSKKKALTICDVLQRLNQLVEQDPEAITKLAALRVDCGRIKRTNPEMLSHRSFYERPLLGFVELLNLLFESDTFIHAETNGNSLIHKFKLQYKHEEEVMKAVKRKHATPRKSNRRSRVRQIAADKRREVCVS